jgi:hypothetical protein
MILRSPLLLIIFSLLILRLRFITSILIALTPYWWYWYIYIFCLYYYDIYIFTILYIYYLFWCYFFIDTLLFSQPLHFHIFPLIIFHYIDVILRYYRYFCWLQLFHFFLRHFIIISFIFIIITLFSFLLILIISLHLRFAIFSLHASSIRYDIVFFRLIFRYAIIFILILLFSHALFHFHIIVIFFLLLFHFADILLSRYWSKAFIAFSCHIITATLAIASLLSYC